MSELAVNSIIASVHSMVSMMNPKLSFHFEKIESVSSCFKNLSVFSNLFISAFTISTFFFKNFLYRIAGYENKDIYSSYLEDKEYNIFFTALILIAFNLSFPTKKSRGQDSIYKSSTIGAELFKLMHDLIKSFKFTFFFEKFYELHSNLLKHTEQGLCIHPFSSINTLMCYFIIDFYFCNFSSTTASIINILFVSKSRNSNWNLIKQKSIVFTFIFTTFYFIRFRQLHLSLCFWLGIKTFYGMDNSLFFVLTFFIVQVEKHFNGGVPSKK